MEILLVALVVVLGLVAFFVLKKKKVPDAEPATREAPEERSAAPQPQAQPVEAKAQSSSAEEPAAEVPQPADEAAVDANVDEEIPVDEEPSAEEVLADGEIPVEEAGDSEAPEIPVDDEGSPPPPPVRGPAPPTAARQAELASLRKGLARSRDGEGFFGRLKKLLTGKKELDPAITEELEEVLLTSDVGVATTEKILEQLKEGMSRGDLGDEEKVFKALREEAHRTLAVEGTAGALIASEQPTVVLFVGVNGAGKTTTIGKLAQKFSAEGKKVMLAAGDTFRAAAVDQLKAWGERTGCEVISGKENADPSSVLFDAVRAAKDAGADILLADTAGRLHTKANLMQEMEKIEKTADKALAGAPHEIFLVIDATNGQNAMAQAREFKEALNLTGLVLTKLDGTAKGGVVLGICDTLKVPVRYVGVGEKAEDLHEFDPAAFVEALLGAENSEIAA